MVVVVVAVAVSVVVKVVARKCRQRGSLGNLFLRKLVLYLLGYKCHQTNQRTTVQQFLVSCWIW